MIYQRKVMNKGFGLTMLSIGTLFIIYALTASDSVSPNMSQIIPGAPTFTTLWLLFVGAGAVTFGTAMTFNPIKSI